MALRNMVLEIGSYVADPDPEPSRSAPPPEPKRDEVYRLTLKDPSADSLRRVFVDIRSATAKRVEIYFPQGDEASAESQNPLPKAANDDRAGVVRRMRESVTKWVDGLLPPQGGLPVYRSRREEKEAEKAWFEQQRRMAEERARVFGEGKTGFRWQEPPAPGALMAAFDRWTANQNEQERRREEKIAVANAPASEKRDPSRRISVHDGEVIALGKKLDGVLRLPLLRLRSLKLAGSHCDGIDLSATSVVEYADFSGASLREGKFTRADLRAARFAGADLRKADLRDAFLANADFSGADLRGADLSDANLAGANLLDAKIDASTKLPKSLPGAQ